MNLRFTLTHAKSFTKDQAYDQVAGMKLHKNNSVIECNIHMLAGYLGHGHSFFPAATAVTGESMTITHESFVSTDLLVADVDHADFTPEDILRISSQHNLNVAMIYESLSSSEEKRRYRVIYQIERLTDKVAFSKAQKYLIYVFGNDYVDKVVVDTGCFDPGRVYFSAKKVVYVNDVMTDVNNILTKCAEMDIDAVHSKMVEINAPFKKAEQERKKAEREALKALAYQDAEILDLEPVELDGEEWYRQMHTTKVVKQDSSRYEVVQRDLSEIAQMIVDYLQDLKNTTELPKHLDVNEIKDWVSQNLHLTDALQLPAHKTFACFLHDDEHPSAAIVENGQTEGYHCHGCRKTWTTFAFIQEVFAREFGQSVYDTERFICSLLGIEYGSAYQLNVIHQLNRNNLKIIRKLTKPESKSRTKTDAEKIDDRVAKVLKRNGSLAILKAFVEISLEQSLLAPITRDDDNSSSHAFVSLGFLQAWLFESGVTRGMKDLSELNRKIVKLCEYGLLERIDFNDIRDSKIRNVLNVRERSISYLNETLRNRITKAESTVEIPEEAYKLVYYYRVPFWSEEHFTRMLDILDRNKSCGKKGTKTNKKRLDGVNSEQADSIYLQTTVEYSKKDLYFIETVSNFIDQLIEGKQWFDVKELNKVIDRRKMSASERSKAIDDLLPGIILHKGFEKVPVNKERRELFNIPDSIKSKRYIYTIKK